MRNSQESIKYIKLGTISRGPNGIYFLRMCSTLKNGWEQLKIKKADDPITHILIHI